MTSPRIIAIAQSQDRKRQAKQRTEFLFHEVERLLKENLNEARVLGADIRFFAQKITRFDE